MCVCANHIKTGSWLLQSGVTLSGSFQSYMACQVCVSLMLAEKGLYVCGCCRRYIRLCSLLFPTLHVTLPRRGYTRYAECLQMCIDMPQFISLAVCSGLDAWLLLPLCTSPKMTCGKLIQTATCTSTI